MEERIARVPAQNTASESEGDDVVAAQTDFFRRNGSGCAFAAFAARAPRRFEWRQVSLEARVEDIDEAIADAIQAPGVSTLSLAFPAVKDFSGLMALWQVLRASQHLYAEEDSYVGAQRCLHLRAQIGELQSWVTGFGPFDFLPRTRRAPHTEITFRVKPRPPYPWVAKPAPENVVHLADMDMQGMPEDDFWRLWKSSHARTERLLGKKPDQASAAKTTFAIPIAIVG